MENTFIFTIIDEYFYKIPRIFKGAGNSLFAVVGALRVFATIFVWTFTLYCVKYNGANFIIKMCVNLHMNSNIHNEFPAQGANFIIKMCVNLHMNSNIHNEFPAPFQDTLQL